MCYLCEQKLNEAYHMYITIIRNRLSNVYITLTTRGFSCSKVAYREQHITFWRNTCKTLPVGIYLISILKHTPAEKQLSNGAITTKVLQHFKNKSLAHFQQEATYCDNDEPLKLEIPLTMGAFTYFRILPKVT